MNLYLRLVVILSIILLIPMATHNQTETYFERAYTVSQDGDIITWHHDCSNISEFRQVYEWNNSDGYTHKNGTMVSDGEVISL